MGKAGHRRRQAEGRRKLDAEPGAGAQQQAAHQPVASAGKLDTRNQRHGGQHQGKACAGDQIGNNSVPQPAEAEHGLVAVVMGAVIMRGRSGVLGDLGSGVS